MRALSIAILMTLPAGQLLAAEPGRNTDMDRAIDRALLFLQRTQDSDGAWRLTGSRSAAGTGLCVMAFLSAGHVPGEGPYAETIEKGVRWVLKTQQTNGVIASDGGHEMYHHGICTLMLAEVAGMTVDERLGAEVRQKLEKAVAIILKAQRPAVPKTTHSGGWRYQVQSSDSDISVSGWQLLALRAAKNLGCDVPGERIEWAVDYLKRCQDAASGGFCYMPGIRTPTTARTGTGVLGLEICGKHLHRSEACLKGGRFLLDRPIGQDGYF
jgi:prenyltransferase beta subunit